MAEELPTQSDEGRDPFGAVFGEAPPTPVEDENENIPDEITALFEEQGLNSKWWRCDLKQMEGSEGRAAFVASYEKQYPEIEDVALNYGPGRYLFTFFWRARVDGKQKNHSRKFFFVVSEAFRERYDEYQFEKRRKRRKVQKDKIKQDKIERELDIDAPEGTVDPMANAREYIQQHVETNRMLGLSNQQQQPKTGFDLAKITPIALAALNFFSQQSEANRQRNDNMMAMMMKMSNDNTNNMIQLVAKQGNPNGADYMKEVREMVMAGIDMKKMMSPPEETVLDKVMGVVEGALPLIASMAVQGKAQREESTQYKMAQQFVGSNPEFQQVINNPAMQEEMINRLDSQYGWDQTDQILEVAGIRRSAPNTNLSQRFPAGDPNNNVPTADAVEVEAEAVDADDVANG